jgi:hypothetical protein
MKGPYTYSGSRKPIVEVAIAGFVLATLSSLLQTKAIQGCHLVHSAAWVAFRVLRPAILAVSQSGSAHLCQASNLLQHLLQIVASIKPLLCLIAG